MLFIANSFKFFSKKTGGGKKGEGRKKRRGQGVWL